MDSMEPLGVNCSIQSQHGQWWLQLFPFSSLVCGSVLIHSVILRNNREHHPLGQESPQNSLLISLRSSPSSLNGSGCFMTWRLGYREGNTNQLILNYFLKKIRFPP